MKKWIVPLICTISLVVLIVTNIDIGPKEPYVSCGDTYNEFLFIPAKSANFTIRFRSPFSGGLTLIDENGAPLSGSKYKIQVNGKDTGPSFRGDGTHSLNVSIRCTTNVRAGRQYVRVQGGGPLVTHIFFTHHMNPLLYWLTWLLTALSFVCLIWFAFIRRIVYPQFKSIKKTFIIPGHAPLVINFTGKRLVVVTDRPKKDSFWSSLIKGEVLYKTHPAMTSQITMFPKRKGILIKAGSTNYKITPNPMPKIGKCEITDINNNLKITVQ